MVTIDMIINLIRSYSKGHEDRLAQLQSDLPFFLQSMKFHRDGQEAYKKMTPEKFVQEIISKELSCAEFRTLVSKSESRIIWHLLLDIFERLNEALALDNHDIAHGEAERITREVHMTVEAILLARPGRIELTINSSDFGQRRIATVHGLGASEA
jgi:hypothetical protein